MPAVITPALRARREAALSPVSRAVANRASAGKPSFGGKKPDGFKKKFVGKAAGAKGSYKGGKAQRAKRGV